MQNHFDILIVGGGPTGIVLANLLGNSGIKVGIMEKQKDVFPIPRATHVDEETLRNFQMTGLMAELNLHTSPFGTVDIVDENGKIIFTEEVIQKESEHNYLGSRFFDQPAFERILRRGIERFSNITLFSGIEVQNIEQAEQIITITALDIETNQSLKYTANYLVGADGGRSIVRTALNIAMNALEPARDWVIVDTLLKNPADANLLPNSFRYVFNPERLTIFAYGIGINNRWEFQLGKDEAMPTDEVIKSWVAKDISLDKIDIIRIAKYAHNSLVATKWRENKIFLAGDAAHMMPPSAGQGLCSGVRDAVNLAWKLVAVIQNHAPHSLLDTYEEERKPHLLEILKRTLFFGNRLQGDNPLERLLRKIQIQAIEFITPLKEYLRATHNTPPIFTSGFLSKHSALSGKYLPQFAINNQLTDDIIGYNFVLVALPNSLTAEQIKQVKDKNFVILHENIDLSQTNYATWLQKNDIDFALIRPDKIIFGTGKKAKFDVIFSELF